MQATMEIPYEIEALALHMGTTPKMVASVILDWFMEPMLDSGLTVHTQRPKPSAQRRKVNRTVGDFGKRQRLDRGEAVQRMAARAQLTAR